MKIGLFFTEGTNLFTIGNLFYSPSIGGLPSSFPEATANEEIMNYPSTVDLISAIKISKRTEGEVGISFLNAITEKIYATIRNTETDEYKKEVIEPLTNYNVLVFDQRFK